MRSSERSRPDILKLSLGMEHKELRSGLPKWLHDIDEEMFQELVGICQEKLTENQIGYLLSTSNLTEAIGLLAFFLNENGDDGSKYLMTQSYYNEVKD